MSSKIRGVVPPLAIPLKDGELDFAILENQPTEPGIVTEVLGYKKLVFLAPDKAPYNQTLGPVPIETLLKWPMIVYEWHSGRHMVGNRHFRERYGLSLRDQNMVGCFDTHEAMVEGVKAGLGWATLPECIASRYRNEPGIVRFKVATDTMWYPVSLTWPSSTPPERRGTRVRRLRSREHPRGLLRRRRTGERTPACPAGAYRPPFGIVIPR